MFADQSARSASLHCKARHDCLRLEGLTARWLAVAFVLYGLLATAFLAINMPPFQNPDEPTHFLRAAQVADGGLVGSPNTAIYPPLFYAPSAIGVLAGRVAGMTVVQTLVVSRLLTGMAAAR